MDSVSILRRSEVGAKNANRIGYENRNNHNFRNVGD